MLNPRFTEAWPCERMYTFDTIFLVGSESERFLKILPCQRSSRRSVDLLKFLAFSRQTGSFEIFENSALLHQLRRRSVLRDAPTTLSKQCPSFISKETSFLFRRNMQDECTTFLTLEVCRRIYILIYMNIQVMV